MVKVSVVIPIFNVENYLKTCIDSVISQTLTDLEIICIDDGSSDNSLNILKEYKDPRIKIIHQNNKGLSSARNIGIENANGEYITFIDSDDYISNEALEKLYAIASKYSTDIILTKIMNFYDETGEMFNEEYFDMDFLKEKCNDKVFNYEDVYSDVLNISVTAPAKLFKREFISNMKFNENLIFEDNPFFVEAVFKAKKLYFIDEYLYFRMVRNDSITNSNFSRFSDIIEIYNIIYELLKEFGVFNDFNDKIFKKKYVNIYRRFMQVTEEYKKDFFKKINEDFKVHYEYLKNDEYSDSYNKRAKYILKSGALSKDYKEFEKSIKKYDNKKNKKSIKKYFKQLFR